MATYEIPVQETTDPFGQQVELDGLLFDLLFLWNARDGHWSMTISRDDVVLISEVKLIITEDLLAQYTRIEDLPAGIISISDLDGLDRDPDDTIFGDRVILIYEEASS